MSAPAKRTSSPAPAEKSAKRKNQRGRAGLKSASRVTVAMDNQRMETYAELAVLALFCHVTEEMEAGLGTSDLAAPAHGDRTYQINNLQKRLGASIGE